MDTNTIVASLCYGECVVLECRERGGSNICFRQYFQTRRQGGSSYLFGSFYFNLLRI